MSVYQALSLMIAFATLVLLITDHKNKKYPSNTLAGVDGYQNYLLSYRLFNGSTWGVLPARPFSISIIACE